MQLAPPGVPQPCAWTEALWQHELHAPAAAAFLGSAEASALTCYYILRADILRSRHLQPSARCGQQAAQLFAFVAAAVGHGAELHLATDVGTVRGAAVYFSKGAGAIRDAGMLQARKQSTLRAHGFAPQRVGRACCGWLGAAYV